MLKMERRKNAYNIYIRAPQILHNNRVDGSISDRWKKASQTSASNRPQTPRLSSTPYIQTESGVDMGQPGRGRARPLRRNEQFDPNKAWPNPLPAYHFSLAPPCRTSATSAATLAPDFGLHCRTAYCTYEEKGVGQPSMLLLWGENSYDSQLPLERVHWWMIFITWMMQLFKLTASLRDGSKHPTRRANMDIYTPTPEATLCGYLNRSPCSEMRLNTLPVGQTRTFTLVPMGQQSVQFRSKPPKTPMKLDACFDTVVGGLTK